MKIENIKIFNFRLLKALSLDLEDNLSLVIGKNNTGKTSILSALDKFLNPSERNRITYDDFNIDFKTDLVKYLDQEKSLANEIDYTPLGLRIEITIKYNDDDILSHIVPMITNLDEYSNLIILHFRYEMSYLNAISIINDYSEKKEKFNNNANLFLKEKQHEYFGPIKHKSQSPVDPTYSIDLDVEKISTNNAISFKYISAKRDVTNKDTDKTLSSQTSRIYKKTSDSIAQTNLVEEFKKKLRDVDGDLSNIYQTMFKPLLNKVEKFGGLKTNETRLKIASTLQHRNLLDDNTTVLYSHDSHDLPEHFNGLGYMNLISMIFEIEVLMSEFKKFPHEMPASINLLFIEEPEAHTHPQMQYVFIKNIKLFLQESRTREDGFNIHLQTIISTHSSHILSESDFDDIKYLKKESLENSIVSKNLKSLEDKYTSLDKGEDVKLKKGYKFLKQYLTLCRSELFFADKAIFIEGDTERILLPAMMRKIDQESSRSRDLPLLSQNISIIEVGAHSDTFEKFIDFIGVKTLIITDIDSYYIKPILTADSEKKENFNVKCPASDPNAKFTANNSLVFFYGRAREKLQYFKDLEFKNKVFSKTDSTWKPNISGILLIAYQTKENNYHARSFEDAFFNINKPFLGTDASQFPSLTQKWFDKYINNQCEVFEFTERAINSKPSLAIEILLNSEPENNIEFSNWEIPSYIKEGLEWLRKD